MNCPLWKTVANFAYYYITAWFSDQEWTSTASILHKFINSPNLVSLCVEQFQKQLQPNQLAVTSKHCNFSGSWHQSSSSVHPLSHCLIALPSLFIEYTCPPILQLTASFSHNLNQLYFWNMCGYWMSVNFVRCNIFDYQKVDYTTVLCIGGMSTFNFYGGMFVNNIFKLLRSTQNLLHWRLDTTLGSLVSQS